MSATTIVRDLRVEATAKTTQLDAALQASAGKVDGFKKSVEGSSLAGKDLSRNFGQAATQVASAAENIARSGKASGDALKQIAIQGSQMALFFGPQGAIVSAIAVSTLAIVGLFGRVKAEAKAAREQAEDEFAKIRTLSSSTAAAANANRLAGGDESLNRVKARETGLFGRLKDPEAFADAFGIAGVRERLEELGKLQNQLDRNGEAARAKEIAELQKILSVREAALQESIARTQEMAKIEQRAAEITRDQDAKSTASTTALRDLDKERVKLAAELVKANDDALASQAKTRASIEGVITAATQQLGGVVLDPLEEQLKKLEAISGTLDATELSRLRTAREMVEKLKAQRQALKDAEVSTRLNTEAEEAGLRAIEKAQTAYDAEIATMREQLQLQEEALRNAQAFAFQIQQAVNGVLQLAQSFGLVDEKLAGVLRNVAQVASNIDPLLKALKAGSTGDIITSGLAIAGGIAALIGPSGDAKAALKLVEDQVESLGDKMESFTRSFSPAVTQFGADLQRITDFVRDTGDEVDKLLTGTARRALRDAGGDPEAALTRLRERRTADPGLDVAIAQLEAYIAATKDLTAAQKLATEEAIRARRERVEELRGSLQERLLRAQGRDEEADALARARRYEEERAQAIRDGAGVITLAMLEMVQAMEEAAIVAQLEADRLAKEAFEAEALEARRTSAETRLAIANASSPQEAEDIRRRAQYAAELKAESDDAIRALLQLAQAAEEAAVAATRLRDAQRALEDLEVRRLRAEGNNEAADRRELELRQQRERETAQEAGATADYLAELERTQEAERRAFERSITESIEAGAATAAASATRTRTTGSVASFTGATLQQTDRLLGLLTTANAQRQQTNALLASMAGLTVRAPAIGAGTFAASGPVSITFGAVNVSVAAGAPADARAFGAAIADQVVKDIERKLARNLTDARRRLGETTIT